MPAFLLRPVPALRLSAMVGLLVWAASRAVVAVEPIGAGQVHPLELLALDDERMLFSALGRDWDISLEPRSLLSAAVLADIGDRELPRLLGGRVVGDTRSWVRLARTAERLSGHLFADDTLYRIEPPTPDEGYRLIRVGRDLVPSRLRPRARDGAPLVSRAMRIGIVIDSRYDERSDGAGLARALGIMNGVDGLYRDQLGLAVVIDQVRVHDDPESDPMRTRGGTVEEVLTAFRDVRRDDPGLSDDLALVHLFSGHEDPDEVIGLGWIDTVCRLDGYDVSMSTPFPFDTLLSAHEIAHNLGALHDEDPRCAVGPDGTIERGVMEERLSGTTTGEFSACSLERLQRTLGADCFVDSLDLALDVRATLGIEAAQRLVAVRVVNTDPWRTARAVSTRARFPDGTVLSDASAGCAVEGTLLACEHGDVAPEATSAVAVLATLGPGAGAAELAATITHGTRVDSEPGNDRVSLRLRDIGVPGSQTAMAIPAESTVVDAAPIVAHEPPADEALRADDGTVAGGGSAGGGGDGGRALLSLLAAVVLVRRRSRQRAGGAQRSRSTE